jgi:ribonucleoside-diphosphate reductase alpha chain
VVSGNCSEIILRPNEFCNLSEVIIRPHDTLETLTRKVTLATIYGTLQSTLTNFVYLPPIWKQNCEEERLLGVSMSGWMDHPILSGAGDRTTFIRWMETLRNVAHAVNEVWAAELGIPKSAAITCVKPSGTVSQLADCASGLHPRYAQFYERRVLADKKDPLARAMVEQGYPYEQSVYNATNYVFAFPIAAPATSHLRDDRRAIEQLKHWLLVDRYWCDHKPSVTIYVREDEWMEVGAFVYENFDALSGISFFPHSDHVYDQAPYTEIDEDEYQRLLDKMPEAIDLSMVSQYESSDQTIGAQELACAGGACEIP